MGKIIEVSIIESSPIDVTIDSAFVTESESKYRKYSGQYDVTPITTNMVTLETKDKILLSDIHVFKIPYIETTNTSDGLTVYIGESNII